MTLTEIVISWLCLYKIKEKTCGWLQYWSSVSHTDALSGNQTRKLMAGIIILINRNNSYLDQELNLDL